MRKFHTSLMLACVAGMLFRSAEPGTDGSGSAPVAPPAPPVTPTAAEVKAAAAQAKAAAAAQAKALKEQEKADKKAKKDAETAAKAAEKEAEKAAKEAEKAAKEAAKGEKLPEQNGIRRPAPETACGKAWGIMDSISAATQAPASIKAVLEQGTAQGLNEATLKTQYARWRKFNGVTGYVVDPRVQAEKDAKEAEKAAQKAAREAEALAKAQAAAAKAAAPATA